MDPFYESMVDSLGDPVLGANPNSGFALGHQFAGSSCSYDTPPAGQTHAAYRFCMKGGPTNSGANAGWEYDIWNGSSWVSALGVSGQSNATANLRVTGATEVQGGLTASSINGEVTVDGVTYANLGAAWNAAYALATSTGKDQTVRLGPGTFAVTATLSEPTNGACISLLGSGGTTVNAGSAAATTLNINTSLGGDVFYLGNATQAQGCTFRDFVILTGTNATHGFELQYFRGLLIDNVTVNDTTAEGILLGEESTTNGHQANFLLRNVTVSYNASLFTPANRPAYGVHLLKTAIDSHLDDIVVRNALTAGVYNEGTGNTGSLVLEAGGVQFGSSTQGVINGLYYGVINTANCLAGFQITQPGGATVISPLVNGVVSGSSFSPVAGHMYTLRLRISCNEMQRVLQFYNSIDDTGTHTYGGVYLSAGGNVVLEVQDTTGGVASSPVILYSGSVANAPAAMTVALINSASLQCSIASFEISQQGPVWVVSTPPGGGARCAAHGHDCAGSGLQDRTHWQASLLYNDSTGGGRAHCDLVPDVASRCGPPGKRTEHHAGEHERPAAGNGSLDWHSHQPCGAQLHGLRECGRSAAGPGDEPRRRLEGQIYRVEHAGAGRRVAGRCAGCSGDFNRIECESCCSHRRDRALLYCARASEVCGELCQRLGRRTGDQDLDNGSRDCVAAAAAGRHAAAGESREPVGDRCERQRDPGERERDAPGKRRL